MKTALMIGAVIGATVLAYYNTLPGQFVYDDKAIIVRNPLIRRLDQIPLLFGTSYWGMNIGQPQEFKGALYRPLTMMTYALNFHAGQLNPAGYHRVNLLLHIGVSLLLWLLCRRLGLAPATAGVAAFLFAVLPIHTEAVSNIVGRAELLSAFFVLLAWILVSGHPSVSRIGLGAICYALALLSKENAASFWPVLILSDYVFHQKPWKNVVQDRLLVWVVYGGCLLLYLEWRYLILGHLFSGGEIPYFMTQGPLVRLLTMAQFTVQHYLKPLILGTGLCAEYTRPSLLDARVQNVTPWACAFLLCGLIGYSFYSVISRKSRVGLCVLTFFGLLLPATNLAVQTEVIGAERFLYLPSIAYSMGFGLLFEQMTRSRVLHTRWMLTFPIGLFLWYGWNTFQRNKAWQTEESFWETTVHDAPQSPRAWNGLGIVLMNQGKYDRAMEYFNRALGLNPMLLDADYNLATCFFLKGDYRLAKKGYLFVARQKPYDPETLYHLAILSEKERDVKSAGAYYAMMLVANPLDQAAQKNLDRIKSIKRRAGVPNRGRPRPILEEEGAEVQP